MRRHLSRCRGRDGGAGREREKARPAGWRRAACNRWEAGPAGAGARAVPPRVPGGGGSELAGGGLSPAPACPARSEDAGGRCPGPGTRSVTRRCSCWPSSVPVGPWSTTAARNSSTTCGTAPDPGSATQVSAAATARRGRRALGWELGPHRGLRQKSGADWKKGRGVCPRARGGDQEPAPPGLTPEPGGDPGEGCGAEAESRWAGVRLEGPRPPPALPTLGLLGAAPGRTAPRPLSLALRSGPGAGRPRRPWSPGKGAEARGKVWEVESWGRPVWRLNPTGRFSSSRRSAHLFPFFGLGVKGGEGSVLGEGTGSLRSWASGPEPVPSVPCHLWARLGQWALWSRLVHLQLSPVKVVKLLTLESSFILAFAQLRLEKGVFVEPFAFPKGSGSPTSDFSSTTSFWHTQSL